MAKDSIRDYSATSSNNSDIQSVDISEGCAPSGLNNAIREVMADLKDVSAGTVALETPVADSFSTDTISEKTSATGVTIDGVLLKDGAIGSIANAVAAHLTSINGGQIGGSRNLIINGNMAVAQRGTQTSITSAYTACDRWNFIRSGAAVVDASQSTDVPSGEGFANSLKIDVTTADTSVAAGDYAHLRTKFEGQDLQQLRKGTSEAKSLALSFWVKSAKTGTHIVELYDLDNARQVSKSYSITTADTWQNVTLQFPADTTGAFGNDNNASLQVVWWLLAGSTYSGGTLNTSWASSTNANRVAGQVNVMDDAANNFYLTGVQLEIGDVATPFEHESYGDTLQKCQRYYFQYDGIIYGQDYGGVYTLGSVCNPVTMRAQPTYSAGSNPSSFTLTPSGKSLGWIIQTSANNISNGVTNLAGNAEL